MQIHFSFSESYPGKMFFILFSWLFCADCLQVKLHSDAFTTVKWSMVTRDYDQSE